MALPAPIVRVEILAGIGLPPAIPSWSLVATPLSLGVGQSSVLSFTTPTNDTHNMKINGQGLSYQCTASGCMGTLLVTPTVTTTYTLTAKNSAGVLYPPLLVTVVVL